MSGVITLVSHQPYEFGDLADVEVECVRPALSADPVNPHAGSFRPYVYDASPQRLRPAIPESRPRGRSL